MHGTTRPARALRRLPALISVGLLVLGIVGTAARLDAPADGTVVDFGGWSARPPGRCWHAAGETWSSCWPWDGWHGRCTSGGPTSRRPVPCSSLPGAGPDLTVVQPMSTQGSWEGVIEGVIRDLAPAVALPG